MYLITGYCVTVQYVTRGINFIFISTDNFLPVLIPLPLCTRRSGKFQVLGNIRQLFFISCLNKTQRVLATRRIEELSKVYCSKCLPFQKKEQWIQMEE